MLLVASGILVFHRGRPYGCGCGAPCSPQCWWAACSTLILTRGSYEWSLELVKTLWSQGEALKSGGVVSGLIALGLTAVFSKYGAGVIFVLIAAIMLMVVFHVSRWISWTGSVSGPGWSTRRRNCPSPSPVSAAVPPSRRAPPAASRCLRSISPWTMVRWWANGPSPSPLREGALFQPEALGAHAGPGIGRCGGWGCA
ncbi:MAG: hypothetical protein ACLRIS_10125 [Flavonifractor plautii]